MKQNLLTSDLVIPGNGAVSIPESWEASGLHDAALLSLSLVLLLFSTIDPGPFGFVIRVCWLGCFVALTFVNIGAALAAYISSLAIYSPLRVEGWSSLIQRPDNYAVVPFFIALLFLALKRQQARPRFLPYVLGFLIYCILNTALLSSDGFPALFRVLVVPLAACVLLAMVNFRERERNAFFLGMALLGGYMGFISVLEQIHATNWMLPPWIGNQSLLPAELFGDNEGRSGGTLMVPALHGLLLSLIFVLALPLMRRGRAWVVIILLLLCATGDFFTLERGVWLGLALALLWFPGWSDTLQQANRRRLSIVFLTSVFLLGAAAFAGDRLKDSDSILFRFALWGAGLRLFIAHPLTGIGFFNFPTAMAGAEQGFGNRLLSYRTVTIETASHNTILTILVELGLAGFLLYGITCFKIIQAAMNGASRLWGASGRLWVIAFVLVLLVNAQFISAFEGTTFTTFFGLLGIMAGAQVESDHFET
jgi:O-antigen ligase